MSKEDLELTAAILARKERLSQEEKERQEYYRLRAEKEAKANKAIEMLQDIRYSMGRLDEYCHNNLLYSDVDANIKVILRLIDISIDEIEKMEH